MSKGVSRSIRQPCELLNFRPAEAPARSPDRIELLREIVGGLPAAVLVVGPDGCLLISNIGSNLDCALSGPHERITIGSPFEEALRLLPLQERDFDRLCEQIGKVVVGPTSLALETFQLVGADPFTLTVRATRLPFPGNLSLVVLACSRSNEKERVSRCQRQIQILRAQDEERRRIARDLHDNTSQQLALIQMKLESLRQARTPEAIDTACDEIEGVLRSAHHQMRTLSYVLHPPELVSGGIMEALRSFLRGFARRTNLSVDFENSIGRLKIQSSHEIALYRVTQEALINVNKHAGATAVKVALRISRCQLVLEIEDNGVGISPDIIEGRMPEALGVGLTGMRERVEALGGTFYAERGATGTRISARFPQRRSSDLTASRLDDVVPNRVKDQFGRRAQL